MLACQSGEVERRRPVFIVAACIVSTLLVTSCSRTPSDPAATSGQPAEPASTSPAAAPPPSVAGASLPAIVTFGDSLTAGVAGRSYPDDLQDLLTQHGYRYRVDNQGVSGDTTTDGLARIDNVTAAHPALVVLEFGGNDGLRGVPVDSIDENLEKMITDLKQAKIPLVLLGITLPPNYGADYVKAFTAMYPTLAKKYDLRFLPFLLLHVYQRPELMQPDGIHPSGEGNKIVAQDVYGLILPLLKSATGK